MRNQLSSQISNHSLDYRVSLEGWSNNVDYFYLTSDVLIISSRWEGFGLIAIEAMSHGLPIISLDVAGLNEILPINPLIHVIQNMDADIIANSLKILDSLDPICYNRYSRALIKHSSAFSFSNMAHRYLDLYNDLLC